MSEEGQVICSDEKEDMYSTMAGEASTKDDNLQKEEIKLSPTSIYRLQWNQLQDLQSYLTKKFEKIELNWNPLDSGFGVQLFAITKESECNLVHVMKNFITNKDDYVKTYTRDTFILIAVSSDESLKCAFAICTDAGYHKVIPYVDTTFAYSVSKKILDPKTVGQLKCRFLNGETIRIDKLFHKVGSGPNLPTVANDIFFIVEGFQAQIKALLDSGLGFLSSLRSSVKVTRFKLKIMKSLSIDDMLRLMKELLHVHLSCDYEDAEEFEFLNYVKPVKGSDLRKELDCHLERYFLEESEDNRNGFFICHNDYEQWVKCEKVQLSDGKNKIKTWEGRPDISDIIDALGEKQRDWSSLQIRYKSNRNWRSDKFINYIHGHVFYERKYYFHIGKDWFKVDVEYIRGMDYIFFKVVKEKLLSEEDQGYLPLPWCSEKYSDERINADGCIEFCKNVLDKDLSQEDETKIRNIDMTELFRSLTLQDNEKERESPSAGNNSANADEGNNPPLSDSHAPVNDNDDGNSLQKKKQRSACPREKRRKYDVSAVKSQLSKIIGEVECKLCLDSLTYGDEGKYNKMYYDLNKFVKVNSDSSLNEQLGVDPDNKFPTFLHGDKILVQNVELCDILKITKDKLYLYHVKEGVGQKTRDAASQIRISADLIRRTRESNAIDTILGKYYEQIIKYNGEDQTRKQQKEDLMTRNCSQEEFLDLFRNKKIVYVYAFLDDTKGRKTFNELVSDKQRIMQKEDFYKAVEPKFPERQKIINDLCESLKSDGILSEKDNRFSVKRRFLKLNTEQIVQIFLNVGFSDRHANQLFQTIQEHFVPTVSVKSHIAKFELIRLAHDFNTFYPDFELRFCQIKKP